MSSGDLIRVGPHPCTSDAICVDESAWPRVVLRWPGGERSDDEVLAALAALQALGTRAEVYTLLVDARDARPPTRAQLRMMLEVAPRFAPTVRCSATAIVTRSLLVKATVDSVRWMYLSPVRWAHFDDVDAATRWLDEPAPRARAPRTGAERRPGSVPPAPS